MDFWTQRRRQHSQTCLLMMIMCLSNSTSCLAEPAPEPGKAASKSEATVTTVESDSTNRNSANRIEIGDKSETPRAPLSLVMATTAPSELAESDVPSSSEAGANKEARPKQILKTGVNLNSATISPNSRQLAEELHLLPLLQRIQKLRGRVDPGNFEATVENLAASQQLTASTVMAMQIIDEANLAIDYVIAEINAEQNIYNELLSTLTSDRDRTVFKTNAGSFVANGILWALAEAIDIPTNHHPNFSTSSGTFGILAGIIPSIASIWAMYQLNGKKETSEKDPNMLSKLLGFPANDDIDFPQPVWQFMQSTPASGESAKSRKDQLIDRWVADKNIPNFTDRSSSTQLDIITANAPRKKGLSIATLNARQQLLQQLSAEILKMKRLLYELSTAVRGAKQV